MDDDLYQNVWSDATAPSSKPKPSSTPPWSPSATLAIPYDSSSWSNVPETRWEAPPGTTPPSWLQPEPNPVWGPSRISSGSQHTNIDSKYTSLPLGHVEQSASRPSSPSLTGTLSHRIINVEPIDAEVDQWTSAWTAAAPHKERHDEWDIAKGNAGFSDDIDTSFGSFYVAPKAPPDDLKPQMSSMILPPALSSKINSGRQSPSSTSSMSYETAESSNASPCSSVPLGGLYPSVISPVDTSQPSAQALLTDQKPPGTASNLHDASHPVDASSPVSKPIHPSAQTPPRPSSRSKILSGLSTFLSPTGRSSQLSSPPAPPPIDKSPRTLAAADAAKAALRSHPSGSSTAPILSSFTPSSSSLPDSVPRRALSTVSPTASASLALNDEDLAEYLISPLSAPDTHLSTSLLGNSSSDKALLSPDNIAGADSLDGLSGFLDSFSACPPSKPAKNAPVSESAPPSASASSDTGASSTFSRLFRRRPNAAQHLRTLSLMEKAAEKKGQRWPAPLSPLPASIPGPSSAAEKASLIGPVDEEDEDAPLATSSQLPQSFSSPAMLTPSRPSSGMDVGVANSSQSLLSIGLTVSESAASNPPSSSSLPTALLPGWGTPSISGLQRTSTPPLVPTAAGITKKPPSVGVAGGGGLSAQDLAFFEGL